MKIEGTLANALYSLFGPNGTNQVVSDGEKRLYGVYRELERHGVVKMEKHHNSSFQGVYIVTRNERAK